jgi:outer membrane protein
MRRPFFTAGLALALSLSGTLARAEQKIAYVDLQRALLEVDEGKAAKSKLKAEFDRKQKALDAEQDSLKKDKEDLDKRSTVMTDDARREAEAKLQARLMDVTNHWQGMQKELGEQERQLTSGIFEKMQGVIAEIAQAEGLTFVFDRNAGLVYAPPSLDLTNELVRRYNDKFPGGGGGKGAAPGKGKGQK